MSQSWFIKLIFIQTKSIQYSVLFVSTRISFDLVIKIRLPQ